MEITSAVVYKPQLQTALEKKTADVFCKNLKKRSGVSLLQSKTSGKISTWLVTVFPCRFNTSTSPVRLAV